MSEDETDQLVLAWQGIQELDPSDENSFFRLGGFHGEPFRGAGWGTSAYWGGYCNHGNVLFPTWHRLYLLKLENALRGIEGCEDVRLPYWDETGAATREHGVPEIFTKKDYTFSDGRTIPNPLYSYTFQQAIVDHLAPVPDANYSKPVGYETVRYPLSGLVGTDEDRKATEKHNDKYRDEAVSLLNKNVVAWLTRGFQGEGRRRGPIHQQYVDCLYAPNYTVFSNTTSAAAWNDTHPPVVPLESPHNSMHLAVGGFDLPHQNFSTIRGANGDMGENDTAGFDPIFYFHHCFVDLVFWLWQKKHGATTGLEIMPEYPGTNTVDNQGPTPGVAPNAWLTDTSPLDPWKKADGTPYTSRDCVDITRLGYDYDYDGELAHLPDRRDADAAPTRAIHVRGIDRTKVKGSFLISAVAEVDGEQHHLGTEAVLSRWHVEGCANCQNHLRSSAVIPLPPDLVGSDGERALAADGGVTLKVQLRTHEPTPVEGPHTLTRTDAGTLATPRTLAVDETEAPVPFYAEVRPIPTDGRTDA
ncbi:tyrosinase family protein [Actinosynnema sp. NPDC059797]